MLDEGLATHGAPSSCVLSNLISFDIGGTQEQSPIVYLYEGAVFSDKRIGGYITDEPTRA